MQILIFKSQREQTKQMFEKESESIRSVFAASQRADDGILMSWARPHQNIHIHTHHTDSCWIKMPRSLHNCPSGFVPCQSEAACFRPLDSLIF